MSWKCVHSVWALVWCPRKLRLGAQTLCMALLLIATTTNPARADCPAAPISDPDDMAISFLAANGVQAASASLLSSTVAEGTLVYDDTADKLKVCDGTNWIDVGSGSGTDTLASLSCTSGQIAKYNGTAWACAADGGGASSNPVAFNVNKGGTNQTVSANTDTLLTWSTEVFDTNNNFSGNRFTPTVPGKYIINLHIFCSGAANCHATIKKNGVAVAKGYDNGTSSIVNASTIVDMNGTTDYVEGSAVTAGTVIGGNLHDTGFSGALVGGGADTLSGLSCATNEIPKWNGTAWACATDGGGGSAQGPSFFAYKNADQTVTASTLVPLTWNAERFDTNNNFDLGTGRFTPTVPGKYIVTLSADCGLVAGGGVCQVQIYKNGSPYAGMQGGVGGTYIGAIATGIIDMNGTTDYVEARVYNTNTTIRGIANHSHFSGALLGGGSDTLAGLSCSTNEIPKWNGTAWACATDGGGSGGGSVVAFSARRTAGNVASGNTVVFDSASINTGSGYNSATGVFTAPVAGTYQFSWGSIGNASANDIFRLVLRKNGVSTSLPQARSYNSYGSEYPPTATALGYLTLSQGDTVNVHFQSDNGTALYGTGGYAFFNGHLLGGGGGAGSGTGKVASGSFGFVNGNCTTAASACAVDISSGGFSTVPSCVVTMRNSDGSGYSENMVIQSATSTVLKVWKGQFLNTGTTMHGDWLCASGSGSLGGGADTLASLSCAMNEIPKWNGTAWACAADGGGGGASPLSGRTLATQCSYTWSANATGWRDRTWIAGDCTNGLPEAGDVATGWARNGNGTAGMVSCAATTGSHYNHPTFGATSGTVICSYFREDAGGGGSDTLAGLSCATNEIPKWNGTAWACATDGNDAGASMTGAVMAFNATTCPTGWTEYLPARGRFLRGIDNGAGNDPDGTRAPGAGQDDALQNITGSLNVPRARVLGATSSGAFDHTSSGSLGATGDTQAGLGVTFDASRVARTSTETRPKNVAVIFCQYNGTGGLGGGGSGTAFGAWGSGGPYAVNTIYQAATDGIVMARLSAGSGDRCYIIGKSDSNATPTAVRGTAMVQETGSNDRIMMSSATFAVKKDDYWRVDLTDEVSTCAGQVGIEWIPLFGGGSGSATAAGDEGQLQFNDGSDGFAADGALHWDNTNKRLGIGTATPQRPLHVQVNASGSPTMIALENLDTTGSTAVISHRITTTGTGASSFVEATGIQMKTVEHDHATRASQLGFWTTADGVYDTRMIIDASGNVGIGTTSPNSLLDLGTNTLGYAAPGDLLVSGRRINFYGGNSDHVIGVGAGGIFLTGNSNIRFDYKAGTSASNGTTLLSVDLNGTAVNVGTAASNANAILNVNSSTKGLLLPRVPAATLSGMTTPTAGLIAYDSTSNTIKLRTNSAWVDLATAGSSATAAGDGGQIQFNDGSDALAADAALHWDNTNKRLGIGTSIPASSLDVNGDVQIGHQGGKIEIGQGTSSDSYAYIDLIGDSTYTDYGLRLIRGNSGADATNTLIARGTGGLFLSTQDAAPLYLRTANTSRLTIDATGNVGIGTTVPGARLTVVPGNATATAVADKNISYGTMVTPVSGRSGFTVQGTNSWLTTDDNAAFGFVHPWSATNADAAYKVFRIMTGTESGASDTAATSLIDRYYVTKGGGAYFGGNVGIGTASPSSRLQLRDVAAADTVTPLLTLHAAYATTNSAQSIDFLINSPTNKAARIAVPTNGSSGELSFYTTPSFTSTAPSESMRISGAGYLGVGVGAPGYRVDLPNTSGLGGRGRANSWTTYSDGRFKTNVETIDRALDKITALRGVSYVSTTETNGERQVGFIAQEVEKIVPEVVSISKTTVTMPDGSTQVVDDYRSLAYDRLVPVLTEAIKELKAANDNLRAGLKAANDNYQELRRELDALKAAH